MCKFGITIHDVFLWKSNEGVLPTEFKHLKPTLAMRPATLGPLRFCSTIKELAQNGFHESNSIGDCYENKTTILGRYRE